MGGLILRNCWLIKSKTFTYFEDKTKTKTKLKLIIMKLFFQARARLLQVSAYTVSNVKKISEMVLKLKKDLNLIFIIHVIH